MTRRVVNRIAKHPGPVSIPGSFFYKGVRFRVKQHVPVNDWFEEFEVVAARGAHRYRQGFTISHRPSSDWSGRREQVLTKTIEDVRYLLTRVSP